MQPTSRSQAEAAEAGLVPPLEQVRDDVWSLGVPMPGGHIPGSLLTLLRDSSGAFHVVDPGWDSDENWRLLTAALASLGAEPGDVRSITVTHLHPDHLGMAARLRAASGAPIQLHEREVRALDGLAAAPLGADELLRLADEWDVPEARRPEILGLTETWQREQPVDADRTLVDGQRLDVPGFDLEVLLTPGHTPGSICLRDETRGLLLSGDHLLPTMFSGLGLGGPTATNALADYLTSLDRIAERPDLEVLPGHGYRFRGLTDRVDETREHHLRRTREVAAVLASDADASVWEIASRLTWTAGWENLEGFYAYSALSQTAMHREFVLTRSAAELEPRT